MKKDFFSERFPKGWFGVLFSSELAAGEIKSFKYFNRDYVAFRGENQEVAILNAHCPHLGAHLGGGSCVGNTIRCPFHGWQFDQEGKCTAIPYSERIPPKAKEGALKWHHVRELNQMIHLWFDPEGGEPEWEVPRSAEMSGEEGWTRWYFKRWRIKTQGKEIIENLVDTPHFAIVHQSPIDKITVEYDRHIARQISLIGQHPTLGSQLETVATYFGPGVMHVEMQGTHESRQVNFHTPVDHESLDLCYGLKLRHDRSIADIDAIAEEYAGFAHKAFYEDVEIWENKVYRESPLLCQADGQLFELRKWYRQFFVDAPPQANIA